MRFLMMFPKLLGLILIAIIIMAFEPVQVFLKWVFWIIAAFLAFGVFSYIFTLVYAWINGWEIKGGQVLGRKKKEEVVK